MKSKIHSILIYPLLSLFAYLLKGKKDNYDEYTNDNLNKINNLEVLNINPMFKKNVFFNDIKYFFDKNSPLYDKTLLNVYIDLDKKPEFKCFGLYDFSKLINIYYSASMLSSRITNDNLYLKVDFDKSKNHEDNLNNFLRYLILSYSSRKIDFIFINKKGLSKIFLEIINCFEEKVNSSSFINFSKSGDLYVLTCEKKKKKFDIIWSCSKREIELTDFNEVFDKFGKKIEGEIKITNSPIYAYH
ncbi:hypothetical protein ACH5BF_13855 [Arcobacter sp. YIC-464]|uniref:hypothetical protein n=1 Tax=Arcobacter sp. YIC-464 TaxID=3376631 RepID=UPI003C16F2F5